MTVKGGQHFFLTEFCKNSEKEMSRESVIYKDTLTGFGIFWKKLLKLRKQKQSCVYIYIYIYEPT